MSNHFCTSESLLAGAMEVDLECLICRQTAPHLIGYVVHRCLGCGYDVDDHLGATCRKRREYLGLSRQEIADLYGVKKSTITQYEKWPSRKYWHWILELKTTLQGVTEECDAD